MNNDAISTTVDSLRNIFAIILALSLGEAFKQIIADRAEDPAKRSIRWDGLFALGSFLLLLIPFYHGMGRYLYDVYKMPPRPQSYATFLFFDVLAFTVEAGLFFVMSRTLRLLQWRSFYIAVVLILSTDTVWAIAVLGLTHRQAIVPWLILNLCFLPVFVAILWICPEAGSKWGPRVALAAMFVRTVLDYATSWSFYFP